MTNVNKVSKVFQERVIFYSLLSMIVFTTHACINYVRISPNFIDFAIFYAAAKLAASGAAVSVYDIDLLNKLVENLTGYINLDLPLAWLYQPYVLLFFMPLAILTYKYALFVWMFSGISVYFFCASRYVDKKIILIALIGFPGFWYNFLWGQQTYFLAAFIGLAFYYLKTNPIIAAFLLSIALVKPHLMLSCFFPLVIMKQWRVILYTGVFYVLYVATAFAVFPLEIWSAYQQSIKWITETILFTNDTLIKINLSAYNMIRFLKYGNNLALIIQAIVSTISLGILYLCWRKNTDYIALKIASVFVACLLITPYTLQYDFALLGLPIVVYYNHVLQNGWLFNGEKWLLSIFWLLPSISFILAIFFEMQITPIVLLIFLVCIYKRINNCSAQKVITKEVI